MSVFESRFYVAMLLVAALKRQALGFWCLHGFAERSGASWSDSYLLRSNGAESSRTLLLCVCLEQPLDDSTIWMTTMISLNTPLLSPFGFFYRDYDDPQPALQEHGSSMSNMSSRE